MSLSARGNKFGQRRHRGKVATGILIIGGQHHTVTPLDGQSQLQGIYAVQSQPATKEGRLAVDIGRGHPLQIEAVDNQLFYLVI